MNFSAITTFISESSLITYVVLFWLSLYFILSFTILFARLTSLSVWSAKERASLESLLVGEKDIEDTDSVLKKCPSKDINHLEMFKNMAEKRSTTGLTWLSIIASTSPFIGLFGTVVSILETFGGLGTQNSLSVIAPKISEALVATGCGILVAIPAYSFHLIIKRKAFELIQVIDNEIKVITKKA